MHARTLRVLQLRKKLQHPQSPLKINIFLRIFFSRSHAPRRILQYLAHFFLRILINRMLPIPSQKQHTLFSNTSHT